MSCLHILTRLSENRLPSALQRSMAPDDALLLSGDAVYAAVYTVLSAENSLPANCHALEVDVRARGLLTLWPAHIPLINHGDYVDLCVLHKTSLSWS
jgi:sulfur relay protein TusB/DsrH